LRQIAFIDCGLGDAFFTRLLKTVQQCGCLLESIDVSQNDLSYVAMASLHDMLKDPLQQPNLQSITLNRNNISDQGLREVANGLLERFIAMQAETNDITTSKLPITQLSIK
jgi:hypothetical protein